ncbi:MAG: response regulator [Blastocatellia bacterium]
MLRPRVLIAEDNDELRELFSFALADRGFEVRGAVDGDDALIALSESRPDVLVTDVMMPHLNGVDLIRKVREMAELADLPIVVLSAYPDYLSKAFVAGATVAIRKPVELDELFDKVLSLLPEEAGH